MDGLVTWQASKSIWSKYFLYLKVVPMPEITIPPVSDCLHIFFMSPSFQFAFSLRTDTEVITYILDLLIRKHKLPISLALTVLASPFYQKIDKMDGEKKELFTALRQIYGSALLNGPFAIVFGYSGGMVAMNDRIKLRPLIAASNGDFTYVASEEAAIRAVCPSPDIVWSPKAGEPVIVEFEEKNIHQKGGLIGL